MNFLSLTLQTSSLILDFIAEKNLSFNVAQATSLQALLEGVSGRRIKMPKRHTLMSCLDKEFNKVKTELRNVLSQQKYICITADVWSSNAQSFLGVTVHFINKEFVRESYVLAFRKLLYRQTYKELAEALNQIFNEYGIKTSQISNIVTDGGSSFCKMFKMFGSKIDVVVSTYDEEDDYETEEGTNSNETHESPNENENTITEFMEDRNGDHFVNEILNLNESTNDETIDHHENVNFGDDDFDSYISGARSNTSQPEEKIELPAQRRCMSHLLNLLSQDFELKYLDKKPKALLCQSLGKLHTLWILTRRSSRAKTIMQNILSRSLKTPCETRWNSKYDAVKLCCAPTIQPNLNKLILELKSKLNCQSAQSLQQLSKNDFTLIDEYVKVMEPVANALDAMQKEFNSSQGYIIPILTTMKHLINEIKETHPITKDFKTAMLEAIEGRFRKYYLFDSRSSDLLLAAVTIPRIKTSFIADDDHIIYVKQLLIAECKKLRSETSINRDIEQPIAGPSTSDDFIISFARDVRRNSIEGEIESEASRFLCDERKSYSILNEYPNIREIYFKFNATLSSSAPVERVFSQSLMIFTPRRNRISAKHFEQTLILKHNRKLMTAQKKLK